MLPPRLPRARPQTEKGPTKPSKVPPKAGSARTVMRVIGRPAKSRPMPQLRVLEPC